MKKVGNIIIFCLFMLLNLNAELDSATVVIQRDRAYLRQGPGAYYTVLSEVPVKTKLTVKDKDDGWLKVTYNKLTGYISKTSTVAQPASKDIFAQMGTTSTNVTISRHGMSAGVKGFGERFTKAFKGNTDFLTAAETYHLDPKEFQKFKKDTYKKVDLDKIRKANRLAVRKIPDYFSEAQEGFGLGVAAAVANLGLYQNPVMQEYVNSIGQLVVEASDVTDVSFKFFILDIPAPNAYACPGGYIFITKGMLQYIQSEAELACILGHEIAHVSCFHGLKEMRNRQNQIAADEAFGELDEELPDAYDEETKLTEQELEDEAFSMYETIIQGRLDAYEEEADVMGLKFAIRAGFNPAALLNVVQRMVNNGVSSNNEHFRPSILTKRIGWINRELAAQKIRSGLLGNASRWNKYAATLN